MIPCPQCGEPSEEFKEGVCPSCCSLNQEDLDLFNAQFDRWSALSLQEKDGEIQWHGENQT